MKYLGQEIKNRIGLIASIFLLRFQKDMHDEVLDVIKGFTTETDSDLLWIKGGIITENIPLNLTGVTDGIIYHNNKLWRFIGGTFSGTPSSLKIELIEGNSNGYPLPVFNSDNIPRQVYLDRTATITNSGTINLIDLKYLDNLKILKKNNNKIGEIIMFHGVVNDYFDINTGLGITGKEWEDYAICNGQNGTPNMKGRVPLGFDKDDAEYDTIDKIGPNDPGVPESYILADGGKKIIQGTNAVGMHKHGTLFTDITSTGPAGSDIYITTSIQDLISTLGNLRDDNIMQNTPEAMELRQPFIVVVFVKKIK